MSHYVKAYHVSPHSNIQHFRGNYSSKMKARGIFVSESWQSVLNDWIGTLLSKRFGKRKPSTLEKQQRKLEKRRNFLIDNDLDETNAYKAEYERLSNKLQKYYKKGELGSYKNLTIYQLLIPKEIFDICKKRIQTLSEIAIEKSGMMAYGAWAWGVETFILEEYLSQIKIIGRRTYSARQAKELSRKLSTIRQMQHTNIYMKMEEYKKEIQGLIQKFGNAPLLDRALRYVSNINNTDIENATRHYRVVEELLAPYKRQLIKRNPHWFGNFKRFDAPYSSPKLQEEYQESIDEQLRTMRGTRRAIIRDLSRSSKKGISDQKKLLRKLKSLEKTTAQGYAVPGISKSKISKILKLREKGLTQKQIAKKMKLHQSTVSKLLASIKIEPNKNPDSELRDLEHQYMTSKDPEIFNRYAQVYNRGHEQAKVWICKRVGKLNLISGAIFEDSEYTGWNLFQTSATYSDRAPNSGPALILVEYKTNQGKTPSYAIFYGFGISSGELDSTQRVESYLPGNRIMGQAKILRYLPVSGEGFQYIKNFIGKKNSMVPFFSFM